MQLVEAQRVYIGQLRSEMELTGRMPRTPIPSIMSMAIPGTPLIIPLASTTGVSGAHGTPLIIPLASTTGVSGAHGAPSDLLMRQETDQMTPRGSKGKPLMCPRGNACTVPHCTFIHAGTLPPAGSSVGDRGGTSGVNPNLRPDVPPLSDAGTSEDSFTLPAAPDGEQ
jgi:hypothetical protein